MPPSAASDPAPPDAATRARMVRQRRRDTGPELAIRRALHARGWRYRVDVAPLPGMRRRADLIFTRRKIAVFVDGCFWHVCPEHGTTPKKNRDWWVEKLTGNQQRDRDTDRQLEDAGWTVLRVWEHEDPAEAADRVENALRKIDRSFPQIANS